MSAVLPLELVERNNNDSKSTISNGIVKKEKEEEIKGEEEDAINVPKLSYLQLFILFLGFGFQAWGGPVAQIAGIKEELVIKEKWISVKRFNRVLAVYQVLPGPEAAELCCYFGYIAKGRIGALLGGLGFILPGFGMLLGLSALYSRYDLFNVLRFEASLSAMQASVAALIVRAVHRIGEHAITDHSNKKMVLHMGFILLAGIPLVIMRVNFFLILCYGGIANELFVTPLFKKKVIYNRIAGLFFTGLVYMAVILYIVYRGLPPENSTVGGKGIDNKGSYSSIFLIGLIGGSVTFGGAYTCIPFVRGEVVYNNDQTSGWMTDQQFLDGLALGSVIPAPLVMFVTFDGYLGHGVAGAILMTIGMFIPAFSFTIIGHRFFEYAIKQKVISSVLDGFTVSVVSLIAVTAVDLTKSAVFDSFRVIIFICSLAFAYNVKHRFGSFLLIFLSACAGQIFFIG